MNWKMFNTDKDTVHTYGRVYPVLFRGIPEHSTIMEVGVLDGGSLILWKSLLPKYKVVGIDVISRPHSLDHHQDIEFIQADAYCNETVKKMERFNGKCSVIIDDGLHRLDTMCFIASNYPRFLDDNGLLIIEDIQSPEVFVKVQNCLPEPLKSNSFMVDLRMFNRRSDDILLVAYNHGETVSLEPNSREEFPSLFKKMGYSKGVEIGVERGTYAQCISNNWKGTLYLVDAWRHLSTYPWGMSLNHEENFQIVKSKFFGIDNVILVRKTSIEASRDFEDGSLDWVYIDASHLYDEVRSDIEAWYPKVRSGGIVAGHDYMNHNTREGSFGVVQAVDEFFSKINLKVKATTDQYPSWWIIKP